MMNQDFEDFLTKKKDLLDAYCTCGGEFKVFVDRNDCYGFCLNCGKKSYQLTCKKCETGFSFGEDNEVIDKINNSWKCPQCGETNQGLPDLLVKLYRDKELPKEVWKEEGGRLLIPRWVSYLIMLAGVSLIIFAKLK